ncbi:hypothetical protein T439DRAFT_320732 [Meredithblackwellia eburnea MCA 4105]
MQSWSPLHLSAGSDDKDSYLSSLTAYLASNPTASLAALAPSALSSPENSTSTSSGASDSNSPAASASDGPTPAPSSFMVNTRNNNNASVGTAANAGSSSNNNNNKRKDTLSSSASNLPGVTGANSASSAGLKDRRSSSTGGASGGLVEHTHQNELEDNENDADGDEGDGGKKGGKTSERRRAQNRAAQRNFRERKEKHLKELEDRVLSLEQQTTDQLSENSVLKQLLERLQTENERLKVFETAFSFTYAKDVSNSSAMPTSTQFGGSGLASGISSVPTSKPPTPPTMQDEVEDLSQYGLSLFGGSSSSSSPNFGGQVVPDMANNPFANASLFPALSVPTPPSSNNSPSPLSVSGGPSFTVPTSSSTTTPFSAATLATFGGATSTSALDDSLFLNTLTAPSPASTTGDSASGSSANLGTPPDLSSSDLFSAYRDPSAPSVFTPGGGLNPAGLGAFPDFDTLFGASGAAETDDGAFSNFFSATSPVPSSTAVVPPPVSGAATAAVGKGATTTTTTSATSNTLPCGASPEKFSFDVDGLCSELTKKAVCREAAKQALKEAMREDGALSKTLHPDL